MLPSIYTLKAIEQQVRKIIFMNKNASRMNENVIHEFHTYASM